MGKYMNRYVNKNISLLTHISTTHTFHCFSNPLYSVIDNFFPFENLKNLYFCLEAVEFYGKVFSNACFLFQTNFLSDGAVEYAN